jgi:hypothetical protein
MLQENRDDSTNGEQPPLIPKGLDGHARESVANQVYWFLTLASLGIWFIIDASFK